MKNKHMILFMKSLIILVFMIFIVKSSFAVESISIDLGNDLWTGAQSDRYLTNVVGVKVKMKDLPDFLKTFIPDTEADYFLSKISQDMYTPEDISAEIPDPSDRPYAGHLYVELKRVKINKDFHDYTGLQIGIIGPAALADKAQGLVHDWTGSTEANGWEYQLKNELGLMVTKLYGMKTELYRNGDIRISNMAFAEFGLGNVKTYAEVGTSIMAGYNPPQNDSLYDISGHSVKNPWSAYIEAEVRQSYVARDIFIDGNTSWFGDQTNLEREEYVTTLKGSVVLRYKRVFLKFSQNIITEQFEGQNGDHNFGQITIQYRHNF